jgi:hypothetical protein
MPVNCRKPVRPDGWIPVVFYLDCNYLHGIDVCPCGYEYTEECPCPGPTMDEYQYMEEEGVMYGKLVDGHASNCNTGIDQNT